ncbi:MAG: hypothetical protein HY320_16460 [Armatimonadetes bacterium]|nr:hypothetical protein [Armatimonadota bacterium]
MMIHLHGAPDLLQVALAIRFPGCPSGLREDGERNTSQEAEAVPAKQFKGTVPLSASSSGSVLLDGKSINRSHATLFP